MKCVSYTRTLPWKNHQGELTIAEQNQRIAAYLAEHKELDLQKKYSDRKNDEKARTAFDQMTNDGVERKFDCIIVASMYYCGPDFPAARQAIEETLYAAGIDLIVLEESLDTRAVSRKEVEDYTLVWERALSLRNPWIQQMAQYKTPEELDRNFVKKYIEQVMVTLLDDEQAEISLTMKTDEWKQMLSRIEVEGTDSGTKE